MAARLRRFKRPGSLQEEVRVIYCTTHGCEAHRQQVNLLGREHAPGDEVLFPIGVYGQGMPNGATFEVTTMEPCPACKTDLRIWAMWEAPTVFDMGALS